MDKKAKTQLVLTLAVLIGIPLVLFIVALITKSYTAFLVSLYPCGLIGGLLLGSLLGKKGSSKPDVIINQKRGR